MRKAHSSPLCSSVPPERNAQRPPNHSTAKSLAFPSFLPQDRCECRPTRPNCPPNKFSSSHSAALPCSAFQSDHPTGQESVSCAIQLRNFSAPLNTAARTPPPPAHLLRPTPSTHFHVDPASGLNPTTAPSTLHGPAPRLIHTHSTAPCTYLTKLNHLSVACHGPGRSKSKAILRFLHAPLALAHALRLSWTTPASRPSHSSVHTRSRAHPASL